MPAVISCQVRDCPHPATHVIVWRTACMSASAFWYRCTDHLKPTADTLAEAVSDVRRIESTSHIARVRC